MPEAQGTTHAIGVSGLLRHGLGRTPDHSPAPPPGQHWRDPGGHPGQNPARPVITLAARTACLP
eukprot:2504776-Pyramimonas_sp.AAC.1